MARTIGFKLLALVPVLFVVATGSFLLLELVPGDPAVAVVGGEATPDQIERVRLELGLDRPLIERYFDWLGSAVTGDFGQSLVQPGFAVSDLIQQALPLTLQLAAMAMIIALVISVPLALWTAYKEGSRVDRASATAAATLISVPPFLAALILIFFFVFHRSIPRYFVLILGLVGALGLLWAAFKRSRDPIGREPLYMVGAALVTAGLTVLLVNKWPDFPRIGFARLTSDEGLGENFRHSILPAFTLALTEIAVFTRLLRTDIIATLQEDFVLAAKAKGMPTGRILTRDALRPSSFSLITLAGVSLGRLIGGTVIIESIFGIQGMGRMVAGNIPIKDFTIVQGGVLVIATAYVVLNLLVDISYSYLDPRIRRGRH